MASDDVPPADPTAHPALQACDRGPALLLPILVLIFVTVSAIAYTDYPNEGSWAEPLAENERAGLRIWREHNCQACHQLYGFGGFHGPDLTNYVDDTRFDHEFRQFLTEGWGLMPALELSEQDQADVLAFLRAMNRTGRSVAQPLASRNEVNARDHLSLLLDAWEDDNSEPVPADVRAGADLWTFWNCGQCHVPLEVGRYRSPDVMRAALDRSPTGLGDVLRAPRGRMPKFERIVDDAELLGQLSALLTWCGDNRKSLVESNDRLLDREDFRFGDIPWWEYE